jgi:zinc transporter 1/2/3
LSSLFHEFYPLTLQLYTAFRLLSVDFIDGPLRRASIPRVLAAVGAMTVGMIAMSVLGKWA